MSFKTKGTPQYATAGEKIASCYHYKKTLDRRIFAEYSDVFLLFAYEWVIQNGNQFLTLTRFILPSARYSSREILMDWVHTNEDLKVLHQASKVEAHRNGTFNKGFYQHRYGME